MVKKLAMAICLLLTAAVASPAQVTTIFGPSSAPTTAVGNSAGVELGVQFKSDVNGPITGIRFYKGLTDTSVHTGTLWTLAGVALATGTFTSESPSGWQQLNFTSPVTITANTIYTASYHTSSSFFADANYFLNNGADNGPLHALQQGTFHSQVQNGVDGGNGVYVYGNGGVAPTQTYNASNYWVDVVLSTAVSGPEYVSVVSGTPQTAVVGAEFGAPLTVKVTDAALNPLSGIAVTFTAPATGASAMFGGSNSVLQVTDVNGIAAATAVANGTPGTYNVEATVGGLDPAVFTLTQLGPTSADAYGLGTVSVKRGAAGTKAVWGAYSTRLGSPVGADLVSSQAAVLGDTTGGTFRFTCNNTHAVCEVSVAAATISGAAGETVYVYPRVLIQTQSLSAGPQNYCEYGDGSAGANPVLVPTQTTTPTPVYTLMLINIGSTADCSGPVSTAGDVSVITVGPGYYDVFSTFVFKKP